MISRRSFLALPALSLLTRQGAQPPRRSVRAVVVGINAYETFAGKTPRTAQFTRLAVQGARGQRSLPNLRGAVNDAQWFRNILINRFEVDTSQVSTLLEEAATADRILFEIRKQLVENSKAGDSAVFFFAGHGSRIRNVASGERDKLDETLVAADWADGVPDIRDKELVRLFREAVGKGVNVTVILDCCYSAGLSRGTWNATGIPRFGGPDERTVNDPPDKDSRGNPLPGLEEFGVLFMTAAGEGEEAGDSADYDGKRHGAFTAAMARSLESLSTNAGVQRLADRIGMVLRGAQTPYFAGKNRMERGLWGQAADELGTITLRIAQAGVSGSAVTLRGGTEMGIRPGCILKSTGAQSIRLQIVSSELGRSQGRVMDPVGRSARAEDIFEIERWVAPPDAVLRVHYPVNGPTLEDIRKVTRELQGTAASRGFQLITEAHKETFSHVISFSTGRWRLETHPTTKPAVDLGAVPDWTLFVSALGNPAGARVFPLMPPPRETAAGIPIGPGSVNAHIQNTASSNDADYLLVTDYAGPQPSYRWLLKDFLLSKPGRQHLPVMTRSALATAEIVDLARSLARVYGWLHVPAPPSSLGRFPYRLALKQVGRNGPAITTGSVRAGETYRMVMVADIPDNARIEPHYVYVFVIDSAGQAQVLFPNSDQIYSSSSQRYPRQTPPERTADLSNNAFTISAPLGVDNYIMVASQTPLDPLVFEWRGAGARGSDPLGQLFSTIGAGVRGNTDVPATWTATGITLVSVP